MDSSNFNTSSIGDHGVAEKAVRLLQAGLDKKSWAGSMECCCNLRKFQDLLSDGKTPYERRVGEPFEGPVIPFGAMVECHPISARDQSMLHQFGKNVLPGIFLGYALIAGEFGKDISWLQILRNCRTWTRQTFILECKRSIDATKE